MTEYNIKRTYELQSMEDLTRNRNTLYGARGVAQPLLEDEVTRHFIKKKNIGEIMKGFDFYDGAFFMTATISGASTFMNQPRAPDSIGQSIYYTLLTVYGVSAGISIIRKNDDKKFIDVVKEVGLKVAIGCSFFAAGYYAFEHYNHLVR